MENKLNLGFEGKSFKISWELIPEKYKIQVWDRIEVRELSDYGDIPSTAGVTQSCLPSDGALIATAAPLNSYSGKYYAVYINSDLEEEIARSDIFQYQENIAKVQSNEIDACEIFAKIKVIPDNCEIEVKWKFTEANPFISNNDYICVMPFNKVHLTKTLFHEFAYALASGKESGKVTLRVGGFVTSDETYQVVYLPNNSSIEANVSDPFVIKDLFIDDESKSKLDSQQFNGSAVMQYMVQEQRDKIEKVELNPLLTIVPSKSDWEKMVLSDKERRQDLEKEAEDNIETMGNSMNEGGQVLQNNDNHDIPISEEALEREIIKALSRGPSFLFVGAGISMSAPSSAPSWWALMSSLLKETFSAMSIEHKEIADKMLTTDASRTPEEIMETYYFVLQDKLFSLFQVLEAGEPNANHKIIAKMAKVGKVKSILTTNFDVFIERALEEECVPYEVICTDEEFRDFYRKGCKPFAVLKIHGTIRRPDTIVAVANHYKSSKGFGGWKATVMHHYIKNYPTVFWGYSGWDFMHANYQEFWESAGATGETIYFMNQKGSRGGPSISKLVGRHVGKRLVIGEGTLPDIACSIMNVFDPKGSQSITDFHHSFNQTTARQNIEMKQHIFVREWVHDISKPQLLAFLLLEGNRLNDATRKRQERNKKQTEDGNTNATIADSTAIGAYMMTLATEMTQGLISASEYEEKTQEAILNLTFATLTMPDVKKDTLKKACIDVQTKHPLIANEDTYKHMIPSFVLSVADVSEVDRPVEEIIKEVLEYFEQTVEPFRQGKNKIKKADILFDLYTSQSSILRLDVAEREKAHELFHEFADTVIQCEWSDDDIPKQISAKITPVLNRLAYQQIDSASIEKSQADYTLSLYEEGANFDDVLDSAIIIALGAFRQAVYRQSDAYQWEEMQQLTSMLAMNEDAKVPDDVFKKIEKRMNEPLEKVLGILRNFGNKEGSKYTAKEVLATYKLANAELMFHCFKSVGNGLERERRRESGGYYPRDSLPPSVASYLSREVLQVFKHIKKDSRVKQQCLGMLVTLGECLADIDQIKESVDASLFITEGRVTELTPYPIPEALAAAYQEKGNLQMAMEYYTLSLSGIQTFVTRMKTDAIVLNACIVKAQSNIEDALRLAFEFSPYFNDVQQNGLVGPGRGILVQQCEAWSAELGLSLNDAKESLTNIEVEVEETKPSSSNETSKFVNAAVDTKGVSSTTKGAETITSVSNQNSRQSSTKTTDEGERRTCSCTIS